MTDSNNNDNNDSNRKLPNSSKGTNTTVASKIPIEIVSEEEMALIEAAFSATRSSLSSSSFSVVSSSPVSARLHQNARSIGSITMLAKRKFPVGAETSSAGDIEDAGGSRFKSTQKRNRIAESLLYRYRRKRGLSVTDITSTEWCEKQMEFILLFGRPGITKAMKAGRDRHAVLEEEVLKRVEIRALSVEDVWGLKFMNFITGVNQLLLDGFTRELPLIGFAEGTWMIGMVDEVRMPATDTTRFPTLVETKTRGQATLPSEPQKRNARLQLMCYKFLWDNMVADNFPFRSFFVFFSLNHRHILSEEIRESAAKSGFPVKTLDDLVRHFRNACCMLSPASDQLLLRYEHQENYSLLGEDQFSYESDWVKDQIWSCLEFWHGEREAHFAPVEERWKCKFCQFASVCKINSNHDDASN